MHLDPYPEKQDYGSGCALILVGLIRIRIHEGKMTHKNRKSKEISCFKRFFILWDEGFSWSWDVI
jgi:hypothetical protein